MTFVPHIRARRLQLGLRQRDLAQAAGVSDTLLRKWERGLELPDAQSARKLASALAMPVERLVNAQQAHSAHAVPGEGYTTAEAANGRIILRTTQPPLGLRHVLDLFCGAGGLSFGFEQPGHFAVTSGIDLLFDRIDTFTANHNYAQAIAGDLLKYPLSDLKRLTGPVDVILGGPPCQGFSSIRPFRNLTEGDPRNSLAEHYVLVIADLQPEWFVFENVLGILTHQGGERLHALLRGFRDAGYEVDWRIVNAALYGVPQHRERIVIIGNRMGVKFAWPIPVHRIDHKSMAGKRREIIRTAPLFSQVLSPPVTLMDAIGDLPPVEAGQQATNYLNGPATAYQKSMRERSSALTLHKATSHSDRMLEIIRHSGPNISAIPAGMITSGFSSSYSRLDPDRPCTTLTVNFVHPASNRCVHPYQNRALTPREGARIQSFPDHFVFKGTAAQIVKQIGNAVPPILGRVIAQAIVDSEDASSQIVGERRLPFPYRRPQSV